jgi:hypothetical protein
MRDFASCVFCVLVGQLYVHFTSKLQKCDAPILNIRITFAKIAVCFECLCIEGKNLYLGMQAQKD